MNARKKTLIAIAAMAMAFGTLTLAACGGQSEDSEASSSEEAVKELEVVTLPTKTVYTIGEYVDYDGLVVKKYTTVGGVKDEGTTMSNSALDFSLAEGSVLTESQISEALEVTVTDPSDETVASASFTLVVNDRQKYAVTFKNYDGTVLDTQSIKENTTGVTFAGDEAALVKASDDTYSYRFAGWVVEGDDTNTLVDLTTYVVTADVTFIAYYNSYESSSSDGTFTYAYVESLNGYAVTGWTDDYAAIAAASDPLPDMVIPESFNNASVVAIADSAFEDVDDFQTLTLPDTIVYIGEDAFYSCGGLTAITIPASVEEMGEGAFYACISATSIVFETNDEGKTALKVLPKDCFKKASAATTITLAEGIEELGEDCITDALISTLVIPDSVTTLYADYASDGKMSSTCLLNLDGLQTITIGAGITAEAYAASCLNYRLDALTAYAVSENSTNLTAVDGVLYSADMTQLVAYPMSKAEFDDTGAQTEASKSFTVPDTVTEVMRYAFVGNSTLTYLSTITLGANVAKLDFGAFYQRKNCIFVLNEGLVEIDDYCFYSANQGTAEHGTYTSGSTTYTGYEFVMPSTVTTIGDKAFGNNSQLLSFTFGASMANFGSNMFISCSRLTEINVTAGSNLSVSDDGAFVYNADQTKVLWYNNTVTITSWAMPDTVKEVAPFLLQKNTDITDLTLSTALEVVGESAFQSMTKVTSALVLPETLTTVGANAFKSMSKVASINIPSSLTSIGEAAFSGLTVATVTNADSVVIQAGCEVGENAFQNLKVTKVDYQASALPASAFYKCTALTEITLSDEITALPDDAFSGCTSLTTMNIPAALETIGGEVWSKDEALTSELVLPDTVTTIAKNAFSYASFSKVTVPASVTSFDENVFSNYLGAEVVLNNALPEIRLPDYTFSGATNLTAFTLPEGTVALGDNAFKGCSSLTSVELPSTITEIGGYCFQNCTSLVSFAGPSVKVMGSFAFSGCSALTSAAFSDDLEMIEASAFYQCSALQEFALPANLKYISSAAFAGSGLTSFAMPDGVAFQSSNGNAVTGVFQNCDALASVSLNSTVTAIPLNMFNGCSSLTSLSLAAQITEVGTSAFKGASALAELPDLSAVTEIGSSAFSGCTGLTSVTMPENESYTEVAMSLFDGCTGLTSITLPANVATLGKTAFRNATALTEITILNPDIEFAATSSYSGSFKGSGLTTVNFAGTEEQATALFTYAKTGLTKNSVITVNVNYGTDAQAAVQITIA